MVDVYTVLSNERYTESLYSSYLGLVPDFGVGFAILSADTEAPTDLNAQADSIGDVVLEALMVTAIEQAAGNFGGVYKLAAINSSITVSLRYPSGVIHRWIQQQRHRLLRNAR
jgi:hypothetical protein